MRMLKGIKHELEEIKNVQRRQEILLRTIAESQGFSVNTTSFIEKHNLVLPLVNISELTEFDMKLNDEIFRNEFVSNMKF